MKLAAAVTLFLCAACQRDRAPQPGAAVPDTLLPTPALPRRPDAVPTEPTPLGVFAYADSSGTRLLTLAIPWDPRGIRYAICQEGLRVAVRFLGHQSRSPAGDGRQLARNFANEAGALYQVEGQAIGGNRTCFLATDSLRALGEPVVPTPAGAATCTDAERGLLEAAKQRPVSLCKRMASIDSLTVILGAQFRPRGDSALASVALASADTVTWLDFHATFAGEDDAWRVGDMGVFHPEDFAVLFVVLGPRWRAIALTWAGEEGESIRLAAAADEARTFEDVVTAYRYWVP
jgi:hypothetical protein